MNRYWYAIFLLIATLSRPGICYVNAQGGEQIGVRHIDKDTSRILMSIQRADSLLNVDYTNTDIAFNLYKDAFDQSRFVGFRYGATKAALGLSYYYYLMGHYIQSEALLNEASKTGTSQDRVGIELNLGNLYQSKGDYEKAMQYYLNTLALYKKDSSGASPGMVYQNIGGVLIKLNRAAEALYYLDRAEQEALDKVNYPLLATVLLNKGEAYLELGQPDHAQYFENAIFLGRKYGLSVIQEHGLNQLSKSARTAGNFIEALQYAEEAESIHSLSRAGKVIILLNKGWAYLGLSQYAKASDVLKKAERDAERVAPKLLPDAYEALSLVAKRTGNYREALKYYELMTETENKQSGKITSQKVERLERDFLNEKKQHEIAKRELQISRQAEIIRRKNLQAYGILSGSLVLGLIGFILFKNQQRIQNQKSEIIAWKSMMRGEENERARIAHELHDNIGGALSTAKVWLSALHQRPAGPAEEKDYEEVLALLDHTLKELRSTAHNLMPELLLRYGLAEAIRLFCDNIQRTGLFKIEYQYIGYIGTLDKNLELIIYRIIQELIHNIVKHAHPTFVLVQLSCHGDILSATIEDNGCGMDTGKLKYAQGMGLQNIRRSISHLKGQFSFRSEPGCGTVVYFEISAKNNSSI